MSHLVLAILMPCQYGIQSKYPSCYYRGLGEHNTQIKSEIELSLFGPNCLVVSSGKVLVLSRIKMSGTNGPNKI